MNARSYLLVIGVSTLVALCLVAGLNLLVDPYGLHGSPIITGVNEDKPNAAERVRVVKPYQVRRLAPRTLIVGNSRPEMGIDPAHECWAAQQRPVYSLTLPGASLYEQYRATQHALAGGSVREIFLAVDFLDFLYPPDMRLEEKVWRRQKSASSRRLAVLVDGNPNPAYRLGAVVEQVQALFSLDTLWDSLATVALQGRYDEGHHTPLGFNTAGDYLPIIATEGQSALFLHKERDLGRRLCTSSRILYTGPGAWSPALEVYSQFVRYAPAHGAKLTVFINPYHVEYLELIRLAGLWPEFQEWIAEIVARSRDPQALLALWSFNEVNVATAAEAPINRGEVLEWFWEPAHYRAEYGVRLLPRLLGRECPIPADGPTPGVRLGVDTWREHVDDLKHQVDAHLLTHPALVQKLRELLPCAPLASGPEAHRGFAH